jgi:mannose-6-phosphate isomerase-like protein (cupin superfamily)
MCYVWRLPSSPAFTGRGLQGFQFGPIRNANLEIHVVNVAKGHDTFIKSKRITRIYYVLEGSGYFTIDDQRYDVEPGVLVEVPPLVEYSYTGSMRLLLIGNPRWFRGNEEVTRRNPDVVNGASIRRFVNKLGFGKE